MIDNKHIGKIIMSITALALTCLLIFMLVFGEAAKASASGITMGYESSLFSTDSIIDVDVSISEDDWADLLENALDEEYYSCDVTVNGTKYSNVGIRAKGNTSLSMVASSDSDRYSFKICFDEYVDGQSCDGLTKLVLNNNYSDATMMKEAICYDMFAFLGADASLYNYAKVSINGEYYGVYLALEPVEECFAMRNYGADYGEFYKPDNMGMGGPGKMKDWDGDMSEFFGGDSDETGNSSDSSKENAAGSASDSGSSGGTSSGSESAGSGEANSGVPEFSGEKQGGDPPEKPDGADDSNDSGSDGKQGGEMPSGQPPEMPSSSDNASDSDSGNEQSGKMPSGQMPQGDFDAGGGKSGKGGQMQGGDGASGGGDMGSGGGANLNYVDDSLDSYDAIWEGSVFNTTDKDHSRVVKALKKICDEDVDTETLAKYMDVDNVLRYMAVHTFVVNLDSLSGNMAHNYYLYEDDSRLNIIPWDYNLAFGGFQSQGASDVINFPIDTPFTSAVSTEDRQFFMSLLENEEYLAQYHEYLQQLAEEYVGGGYFENTVSRITSQIDNLVETDPTSFYSYDEYTAAVEMLKETVFLRAESVLGQLDGSIPSTRDGQEEDSSSLIDASNIDLTSMGVMNGGGGGSGGGGDERGGPGGDAGQGGGPSGDSRQPQGGATGSSSEQSAGDATGSSSEQSASDAPGNSSDQGPSGAPSGGSGQPPNRDSGSGSEQPPSDAAGSTATDSDSNTDTV